MVQRRVRDVVKGLRNAGFRKVHQKKGDHEYYALFVDGVITPILTSVSLGSRGDQIGRPLLGLMAEEVKLDFGDFLRLIDEDMPHEEYVRKLREEGKLQWPKP